MKKLVWEGNGSFRLEDLQSPVHPGNREVLLGVRAVGICGTDIHILNGSLSIARPPLVLGHEFAGEILAIGRDVQRVRDGDRVTVDSVAGCGRCGACLRGSRQFCSEGFEYGITQDGGCQHFILVPEENVYKVDPCISFEEAAILDMEVWKAVAKCGIHGGDKVLVLGCGPIGLIASQVARLMGAGRVVLADVLKTRLAAASALRLADDHLWIENPEQRSFIREYACAHNVDVAIDCAGTSSSTALAIEAARQGGRVLLYGVYERPVERLNINQIVMKDLVVFGAMSDRTGWEKVIEFVAGGSLNLQCLITHRFPLEHGPEAFNVVKNREDGVIKAVLTM